MTSTPTCGCFTSVIVFKCQIKSNSIQDTTTLRICHQCFTHEQMQHTAEVDALDQLILIEASQHTTQPIPDPISTHTPVPVSNTSAITSSPITQLHSSYNVSHLPKLNVPILHSKPSTVAIILELF